MTLDKVRILYIDDNPLDRELVRDALEREPGRYQLVATGSRREFEDRLATGDYDLVLSDFNILGYDGLQVLEAVRRRDQELPVILVTGTGSEEVAVAAMKQGAADYVLKSPEHIRRLPLTIDAVLREKQSREARQEAAARLRRSEEEKTAILNSIPDIAWLKDREGRLLQVNQPYAKAAGRSPEELVGLTDAEIWPRELARGYMEGHRKVVATGRVYRTEEPLARADGGESWLETIRVPYCNDQGEVVGTAGIARDVTERREKESLLRRLTDILEATPDFVGIADRRERVEYINLAGRRLLGLDRDFDVRRLKIADCHPAEVTQTLHEVGMPEASEKGSWLGETALSDREGGRIPVSQVFLAHFLESGEVSHYSTVCRDIREQLRNREELQRLNRTLRVISRCNEALVREREEQDLLQAIVHNLVGVGGYPLAWVGFQVQKEAPDIRLAAQAGEDHGLLEHLRVADCPVRSCVHQTCLDTACRQLPLTERFDEEGTCRHCRVIADRLGIRSAVSLPLPARERNLGCLVLYSREEVIEGEELKLLKELADDLGYGIAALRTELAHRAAEESLRLHHRAIEASSNGIMLCDALDPEMPILYVNPAFERITGYPAAEVLGRNPRFLQAEDLEQKDLAALRQALEEGQEGSGILRNYRRDGSLFWNEFSIAPVQDEKGRTTHWVGVINDITERIRYEEELEHQATHDTLTGLANRNLLADRIAQGIAQSRRSRRKQAVLLLDLDRFKVINDSLGHDRGDELLRQVARRLADSVRSEDTVARLGGDEFVLVLADLTDEDDLLQVAEKVLARLAEPVEIAGRSLQLTASAGISLFPQDDDRPEGLVRKADIAMYQAKEAGKNTFRFYSPEMNRRMVAAMELEADLRHALERDQLRLHFQPKVEVTSGRIVGCEALVRWQHPRKGMIPPKDFIPLAEETGLIEPIGEWILREACSRCRSWQKRGLPPVYVCVNISARQFRKADFESVVTGILAETGLEPRWMKLELTESMIMHEAEEAIRTMQRFRKIGIGLCLDDFGTGYSSLNYLRRFPIDILKVDRSFIQEVAADPGCAAVAQSIVAIAHSLGMQAVAEGVETREQLEFLKDCRCDVFQGFYFSRALPAEKFEGLLMSGSGS